MIKHTTIEKLNKFNGSLFPIMSVYLGEDNTQTPSASYLSTQFHSLIHQNLTADQRKTLRSDIDRIEKYLSHYDTGYKSLLFFSSGENLWQVVKLEFALPNKLVVDNSPYLQPLLKSLQTHSKYLVLLVDREKARAFTVEQGQIVEQFELMNDSVPKKLKSTGRDRAMTQSNVLSRRNDVLLKRHIDSIYELVSSFVKTNNDIQFIIIGGHTEIIQKVSKSLPKNLQAKLVAGFTVDINAPLTNILRESKKIAKTVG